MNKRLCTYRSLFCQGKILLNSRHIHSRSRTKKQGIKRKKTKTKVSVLEGYWVRKQLNPDVEKQQKT